jgi:thiosulfate/3-mercaptopyruvate sulfurtransferase
MSHDATADTLTAVSTDTFADRQASSHHTILDVRSTAAYNGWPLHGEARGGHVPGAKHIPLAWTQFMDWVEVVEEKQVRADAPVTLYGYDSEQTGAMADKLARLGFEDVSVYNDFVADWMNDPQRPLERLPRYEHLVYPEWVHDLVEGRSPLGYEGGDAVLCHAHFNHRADYEQDHIPGAVPLNTNWLESPETWNRRAPDELEEALRRLGIQRDTTVVLYGRFSHPTYEQAHPARSAGHLGAMRCAAILLYAGVDDVRILNGGLNAWTDAGYEVSTEEATPTPVTDTGLDIPEHPEYMLDRAEADPLLAADDGELVSVRSWSEYVGERSGYHYIEQTGRIPGAVFGNCGSDAYHMENYRNFDYTTRAHEEIARKWGEAGVVPEKHIAFYCGTGWRGSEAFMNAFLMGWPRVAVYDGGWFEWSSDPNCPTASGPPEEKTPVVDPVT